ncbi:MAG: hypothetical protein ACFE9T_13255 [Promethearchaeota archaeon]
MQMLVDLVISFGSPEEDIEQIDEFIKADVEYFLNEIWGLEEYFKALELFTDNVFSYFKENFQ